MNLRSDCHDSTKKSPSRKTLTEVELELMNAIWSLGDCTVKNVQKSLATGRDLAYTSVAALMKILEQKSVLSSRKDDHAHTYHALISRDEYETLSLRHLANNLFHGEPSTMVMRLLKDSDLSSEELRAIQKILDERMGK